MFYLLLFWTLGGFIMFIGSLLNCFGFTFDQERMMKLPFFNRSCPKCRCCSYFRT